MGACSSSLAERVDCDSAQHPARRGKAFHNRRRNTTMKRYRVVSPAVPSSKFNFSFALDSFANEGSHHIHSMVGQFDVFSAHRLCEETLASVGYLALRGVAEKLSLPLETLAAFCEAVDRNMPADGYHSRLHVADVLQLMVLQTLDDGPLSHICEDPIIQLSALLGALVHDLKHPHFNNAFLRATNHEMVEKYGPDSTAEKMHFDTFLSLVNDPAFDFLRPLGPGVRSRIIHLVKEVVLSTDMARHSDLVKMDEPVCPESNLIYRLSFAMKISDLSHCFRKFQVHRKFTGMLKQEFFAQGDKEMELGLPRSYGMNRDEQLNDMAEDQVNFLSIFIDPVLDRYLEICSSPLIHQLQESLHKNIESWSILAVSDLNGIENLSTWELPCPACKSAGLEKSISGLVLYSRPRQLMNIAMMYSMDTRPFEIADSPTSTMETIEAIHQSLHTVKLVRGPPARSLSARKCVNQTDEKSWILKRPSFDVPEADEGADCHTTEM